MRYRVYIDGASDCPHDPNFVHENMMGPVCVPKDMPFSGRRAGLSRTNTQTYVEVHELDSGGIWQWDGGCDKAGVTIPARIEEQNRRRARGVPAIVLNMRPKRSRRVGRWVYGNHDGLNPGWRLDDTSLVLDFDPLNRQGARRGCWVLWVDGQQREPIDGYLAPAMEFVQAEVAAGRLP